MEESPKLHRQEAPERDFPVTDPLVPTLPVPDLPVVESPVVELPAIQAAHAGSGSRSLFRNIVHGTSLYLVALLLSRVASILLLPVSTRFLTPADYGALDLMDQVSTVLSLLVGGGFTSAFSYFYFRREFEDRRPEVVGTALPGAFLIGLIAAALGWILAPQLSVAVFASPRFSHYLRIFFLALPSTFLVEATLSWLRTENRAGIFVTATAIRVALVFAGTITLLAGFRLGMPGVLYTTVGTTTVMAIGMTVYCLRATPMRFSPWLLIRMVRYSLPLGVGGIAVFLVHFGDRFILPHYRPLGELGIYGLAYKIAMLISVIYSSFHSYWSAQVFGIMKRDDADEVFRRIFTYLMVVLSFCALAFLAASRPVLRILASSAFQGAADILPVILLAYYFRAVGDFFRCLFLAAGRPHYDAVVNWLGAVICLGGYFLLIPRFGMWGAGSATVASFAAIGLISIVWTRRLIRYRIEKVRLGKVLTALAIPAVVWFLVPVRSLPGQIGWGFALLASYPALLLVLRFPTPGELELPAMALRKLRGYLG